MSIWVFRSAEETDLENSSQKAATANFTTKNTEVTKALEGCAPAHFIEPMQNDGNQNLVL